jgi:hypothetical protein
MIFTLNKTYYQPSGFQKIDKTIFLGISLCLTVFLVFRAILVPMAHDEIATFYYFVQSGKVSPFLSNIDTNNHFLNSLLTWIFYHFFGSSPLALRLSNLVFIPVFFYFLIKISGLLRSRIFGYTLFVTLAFTLHYIEFLALSRGYGMSMALMLGSIYFLLEAINSRNRKSFVLSLLFIFIASTANLALINTYALILAFIFVILVFDAPKNVKSILGIVGVAGILPLSLIVSQVLYIKSNNGLIAGSPENFWTTTIKSLFSYLFETSSSHASLIAVLIFSIVAFLGLVVLFRLKKIGSILHSQPLVLFYLLGGNILTILVLGIFLKVNYPDDRIGLYLYPLAISSLIFLLDYLLADKKWKFVAAVPFLIVPLHFLIYSNTSYSIWYKYDVIPNRFYEKVMENYKPGSVPPSVSGHGLRIFCWSYLDYQRGGMASQIAFMHFPNYKSEFIIANLKMVPGWEKQYDTIDYEVFSERYLLKRHKPIQTNLLISKEIQAIPNTNSEFVLLAEGPADTLINKDLRVDLCLSVFAANKPFNSRITFDIWDKEPKSLGFEYIQFSWLRNFWDGTPGNFCNCMLVYKVPPEASTYRIFIWNIDKTEFGSGKGNIIISELQEDN